MHGQNHIKFVYILLITEYSGNVLPEKCPPSLCTVSFTFIPTLPLRLTLSFD